MTTRQANETANIDVNTHNGVLMSWLRAIIDDHDRIYSVIK